jgi:hypothetical protein
MTPDNQKYYSLLTETSYSEFKPVDGSAIVEQTIQGLINAGLIKQEDRRDIVDTWVFNAKYSYPTPTVERDGILAEAIPFLEQHDVYSRGRFGLWKYEVSNTDHSLMQGVELVNRLLLGEPETTIGIKYQSTDDGRNAASHGAMVSIARKIAQIGAKLPSNVPDISEEELGVTTMEEAGEASASS